jgi:4-amino-4-deoxy-L-arabinose transferase-like glycosyltransferase
MIAETQPAAAMRLPRDRYWPLVALLAGLYLSLGLLNIISLPPLNGPDEPDHLAYIAVLRQHRALPVVPRLARPEQAHLTAEQAQHPPLYYALLAALSAPWDDVQSILAIRFYKVISLLLGLVAILATATLARRLWPAEAELAVGAVGALALLPNLFIMTSVINNTSGSLALGALALLALYRALTAPQPAVRPWLGVGILLALALLTKLTAFWLIPAILAGLLMAARRLPQRSLQAVLTMALPALLPAVLLVGLWLLSNYLRCGDWVPERIIDRRYLPDGAAVLFFAPAARDLLLFVMFVNIPLSTFSPYWLLRVTLNHGWIMLLMALYAAPALVALYLRGVFAARQLWQQPTVRQSLLVACLAGCLGAWFMGLEAVLHDWSAGLSAGRYALDAAPAMALLWAAGMGQLWRRPLARLLALSLWLTYLLILAGLTQFYVANFFAQAH